MALAYPTIKFLFELRRQNILPKEVRLMEFGEQNWFGDLPLATILEAAQNFCSPEHLSACREQVTKLDAELSISDAQQRDAILFKAADIFYGTLFTITQHDAVDLHGTARAQRYDLNLPLPITQKYNAVINFGTGEHVFNQYAFFKNMHDVCDVGGLMLHSMPNQGCYDHGFFNYHPTFIFDLAQANQYEIKAVMYADLSRQPAAFAIINREIYVRLAVEKRLAAYSGLLACMVKTRDAEFVVPQQAYYSNQLPADLQAAWQAMDR